VSRYDYRDLRTGRFAPKCWRCEGHGIVDSCQARCPLCDGDGFLAREYDEAGRRIWPHPDGQRYPLTVGHDPTACRLELPHRGNCWPVPSLADALRDSLTAARTRTAASGTGHQDTTEGGERRG
jgi:hypothetical protein